MGSKHDLFIFYRDFRHVSNHWLYRCLTDLSSCVVQVTTTSGAESLGISLSAQELVSTVDQVCSMPIPKSVNLFDL